MCVRQAISTTIFYYRALTDIYLHPPSLFIHFPLQCSSAFSLSHSPLFRFHLLSTIGAFVEHLLILSLSLSFSLTCSTLNVARRGRKCLPSSNTTNLSFLLGSFLIVPLFPLSVIILVDVFCCCSQLNCSLFSFSLALPF